MNPRTLRRSTFTIMLATLAIAACSGDEPNEGIVGGLLPDMVTDVNEVVFLEVSQGESDTQSITVMNLGEGDLRIESIRLYESTSEDSGIEFGKGDDWVGAASLAPNETLTFSVTYAPRDKHPDAGWIEFQTNDPKFDDGVARVDLRTPTLAPRVYSRPNVSFRRVPPVTETTRDKFWQLTEVENIGSAPLQINDMLVTPEGSDFSFSFPPSMDETADPAEDGEVLPGTLEPGSSFPLRVYFNPTDDLPSSAELVIYSNDPQAPDYTVNLIGNSGAPCMQLSEEDEINFGEGAVGFASNKTMVIENCSPTAELEVSGIEVCTNVEGDCVADDPTFALREASLPAGLAEGTLVIEPGETETFVVSYTPAGLDVSEGLLVVKSNDPVKEALAVPMVGKGTDNQCPQAVAEATLADVERWMPEINAAPLKTVKFRATNSTDSDGTVETYEWNMVQRPNGSTASLAPSPNVPEPTLFLDLAGDYVIELKVFDENGTESCGEQALVKIHVIPNEKLHIQLVWSTPADNDESDTDGTDVDLHFLHPNGEWNRSPWDIYYLNTTADWGGPGAADDPSLDIDDTDGAGPENINLDAPEAGIVYQVGAFYYSDHGFGPSYATVRVYIDGALAYEKEKLLQDSDTFWHVGNLDWPTARVVPTDTTQYDFP